MKDLPFLKVYLLPTLLLLLFTSCKKDFTSDNYIAYFGGEVSNPTSRFVLFCKDNVVLDTIPLNKDNTFFKKFDSLAPGMYTFKNEPEFQYVYFEKNDSLKVHIDSNDFDESVIFCGRGDEKNNFLMELYLKNEKDKEEMFAAFDYDFAKFNAFISKKQKVNKKIYTSRKEEIKWSDGFDLFAKALLNFPNYSKKEIYPIIHKMRTGEDVTPKLPKNYYSFRDSIDYSNETLTDFSPFVMYLNHMLNNVGAVNYHNHFSEVDLALRTNINKLNIADTLIKNEKVKNIVLNNIAFQYLLEDQNMVNNKEFLETYHKYSTDKSKKNEIVKIGTAIQLLTQGKPLPNVLLVDKMGNEIASDELIKKNTVLFFWTEKLNSHLIAAHNKILDLQKKYPNYDFIAINLDENQDKWKLALTNYNFGNFKEMRCVNFEDLKSKWAITKVHRALVINSNRTIKNGFTNLFDIHFEDDLKQ